MFEIHLFRGFAWNPKSGWDFLGGVERIVKSQGLGTDNDLVE